MFNLTPLVSFYVVTVVAVTAQPTPTPPPRADSNFDPSLLIVLVVLVVAFFLVGFIADCIRRCNEAHARATAAVSDSSAQMLRSKGLDPALIESFPIFVYSYVKDLKLGKAALECAVCLSEFEDDKTLRLIPKCCHLFHLDCIDAWLAYHVTCPVCRAKLTPDPDFKSEPDESSSNLHELNSNNNESAPPTTQRTEEQNEFIQINEETRRKMTGMFQRSNSTGHSLIHSGNSMERFTLRLPEEIRKQIGKNSGGRIQSVTTPY